MSNIHRTSRRRSSVHCRPAHWNWREIKEAFAFWLGFEALLNLLNFCGFELFRRLHEAMERELIPGLIMAVGVFVFYTPTCRYGLLFSAAKSSGHRLGQTILKLRVEQILKCLAGHHMRTVLLWVGGTTCIHLTVESAKSVFNRPPDAPVARASVNHAPKRKRTLPTSSNASDPEAVVSGNDREVKR